MSKLRTTDDLREMLLTAIEMVRDKTMEPKQAQAICSLSKEIIKSADIELKAVLTASQVGVEQEAKPLRLTQEKPEQRHTPR